MPADVDTTLALVLAGGAGTRVGGADKGLLPLCGRPLVTHVLDRLRPQSGRVVIAANRRLDEYAGFAPVIHDEGAGHGGPLAGLVAAFGFLAANRQSLPRWLLTAPVDCPDPPPELAARLLAQLAIHAEVRCAFVTHGGRPQPLLALYRIGDDAGTWHEAAHSALEEHGSPQRWHAALGAIAVAFDGDGDAFHNLNTPDEFQAWERNHGRA